MADWLMMPKGRLTYSTSNFNRFSLEVTSPFSAEDATYQGHCPGVLKLLKGLNPNKACGPDNYVNLVNRLLHLLQLQYSVSQKNRTTKINMT